MRLGALRASGLVKPARSKTSVRRRTKTVGGAAPGWLSNGAAPVPSPSARMRCSPLRRARTLHQGLICMGELVSAEEEGTMAFLKRFLFWVITSLVLLSGVAAI